MGFTYRIENRTETKTENRNKIGTENVQI